MNSEQLNKRKQQKINDQTSNKMLSNQRHWQQITMK